MQARVVDPAAILDAWLADAVEGEVTRIEPVGLGWRLHLADGKTLEADVVVCAAGWGSAALNESLPLTPVRGQVSFCVHDGPVAASASGSYAIPAPGGALFGATHDRGDVATDVRTGDDARNRAGLAVLRPNLAAAIADAPAQGRASIRATTPDRMPLAGEIAPGLFILSGLGSRGFCTAPLLADHVAALALYAPSPLPRDLAALVSPARLEAE